MLWEGIFPPRPQTGRTPGTWEEKVKAMADTADRTESKPVKAVKKEEKKPEKKVEKKGADSDKPNPIRQLIDFISDVRRELKKVSWPTRADTMASTWIIIALTFIVSVYLFFCDSILQLLMRLAFA